MESWSSGHLSKRCIGAVRDIKLKTNDNVVIRETKPNFQMVPFPFTRKVFLTHLSSPDVSSQYVQHLQQEKSFEGKMNHLH